MQALHCLLPHAFCARHECGNGVSCEQKHNLLQELCGIEPDAWHFVIRCIAANAVPEAAGGLP